MAEISTKVLRIKRKRTDEPVDLLYIETNRESKRRVTEQNVSRPRFVFRRVLPDDGSKPPQPGLAANIRRPGPNDGHTIVATAVVQKSNNQALVSSDKMPTATSKSTAEDRAPEDRPRTRFYVSLFGGSKPHDHSVPRVRKLLTPSTRQAHNKNQSNEHSGTKSTTNAADSDKDRQVREALLRFAAEQDAAAEAHDPYFPRPLHEGGIEEHSFEAMDIDSQYDDQDTAPDEYTYDTYALHAIPGHSRLVVNPNTSEGNSASYQNQEFDDVVNSHGIGYLVLQPEEEMDFYDGFGLDQLVHGTANDKEGDWDSDQDDENAENYFAADYPEDQEHNSEDSDDESDEDNDRNFKNGADLVYDSDGDELGGQRYDSRGGRIWRKGVGTKWNAYFNGN